jgi:itaconate CoA-transferase
VLGSRRSPARPAFATNAARTEAREALRAIIVEAFAPWTSAEVVARLDAAQIANARVNTMAEVWSHPQLQARGRWVEVDSPAGPIPALLPPGIGDASAACMGAIPALGEHTDALLAELGLGATEIERLRAEGAV